MRLTRTAMAVAAGSTLLLGALGGTADASATLSKSNLLPQGETITINYSNLTIPAGNSNVVFIQQCWKNDSGVFNQILDCSQSTGINPAYPGTGEASFAVFGGADPNLEEWGCGSATPAGIPQVATCYIRLAPGNANNTATDEFYPVTFTGTPATTTTLPGTTTTIAATTTTVAPGSEVPEVPMNVLLPLGGAAVLGGAALITRRRGAKAA